MASVLHGSARTTPCLRAEFQASQESTRSLAVRYGLNPKTVKKWCSRTTASDATMGPKAPKSTLLPLDDIVGRLRDTIPSLSRSALHRLLADAIISLGVWPAFCLDDSARQHPLNRER